MTDDTAKGDRLSGVVTKHPPVLVHVPRELLDRIDDYRFTQRFQSRSEAMRYLMEWALNVQDSGSDALDRFRPERK